MRADYFLARMRAQEAWRGRATLNLLPSENVMSPAARALMASDFGHRYTLPFRPGRVVHGSSGGNAYGGTKFTDDVQAKAEQLAAEVFEGKESTLAPLSGHLAAELAVASVCKQGDMLVAIDRHQGGYDGYAAPYLPELLGLRSASLPFDPATWNVRMEEAAHFIRSEQPSLVVLGASFILFPYPIAPLREACNDVGAVLGYDGSHVLGLIGGKVFQRPLREGADLLFGSTHKSFFGPQGGVLIAHERDRIERAIDQGTWKVLDNLHWHRIAATGHALLELRRYGAQYARMIVSNSKALGRALEAEGFPLRFSELGFTESHQLLIDTARLVELFGLTPVELSQRLERSDIVTDAVGRLGTSELTRWGFQPKEMGEVATLLVAAARGRKVRVDVARLRRGRKLRYTLGPKTLPAALRG